MNKIQQFIKANSDREKVYNDIYNLDVISKYSISPERFVILCKLTELDYGSICQNELCDLCKFKSPSLSRMVKGLHNQYLIDCRYSTNDSRVKQISITKNGRKVVREGLKQLKKAS